MESPGKIWIGTSNGQMPGNKLTFPPAYRLKSRLHYYSTFLNSIEVNSSFYKTPQYSTFAKWSADVADNFRFTLKFSRDFTHSRELITDLTNIESFLRAAEAIGKKKGCLLIQFPGKISLAYYNEVEQILLHIRKYDTVNQWRLAVEFRNESWYTGETTELLNGYNTTMVLHDFSRAKMLEFKGNMKFAYIRFHGPRGNYRESYIESALNESAIKIKDLVKSGKDVYVYFNNTVGGAFENAGYLQSILN